MIVPDGKFDPTPLVEVHERTLRSTARTLGVNASVLCRPITPWQADRFAVRLGHHPVAVWPDWFERVPPDPEQQRRDDLDALLSEIDAALTQP